MPATGSTRLVTAAFILAALLCVTVGAFPAAAHPYGDVTQWIETTSKTTTPVMIPSAQDRLGVSKAAPYSTSALNTGTYPPREPAAAPAPARTTAPYPLPEGYSLPNRVTAACGVIDNCSFETGTFPNWIATDLPGGPFYPLQIVGPGVSPGFGFFSSAPTDGGLAVVNGFDGGGPGDITVVQDVALPINATGLRFDYRAAWDMLNYAGSTLPRTFSVEIQPGGGGPPLQSTLILTAPPGTMILDTGPLAAGVGIASFAGSTVRIVFRWNVPEAFTGPGFFQLDNVTLVQAACDIFANCSFETGSFSSWIATDMANPYYPLAVGGAGLTSGFGFPSAPTDGGFAMLNGFDGGGPDDITLAQDVTLPFAAARITFDYRAAWWNTGLLDRAFSVEIQPAGGGPPLQSTTILTGPAGTMNPDTGPLVGGVPVGTFAGSTVRVVFRWHVPEFFTGPGFFQLDNISVVESDCVAFDNCSFETGAFPNWIATDLPGGPLLPMQIAPAGVSTGFGFFASAPTDGGLTLVNGFDGGGPGDITLAQDVLLPATTNRLQFDFRAAWDMFNYFGSTLPRTFRVEVQPFGGGPPLQTDLVFSAKPGTVNLDSGPRTGTVDLAAFSGLAVRVVFVWHIPENFTGPGMFQLDNVRLTEYTCAAVDNCSFETGSFPAWKDSDLPGGPFFPLQIVGPGVSTGFGFFASAPTDGNLATVNGFDGNGPGDILVVQDVAVPAGATYLEFDYRAAWDMFNFPGSTLARTFHVEIEPNGGGAPLYTTEVLTAKPGTFNLDTGPRSGAVGIGAFAGQTVRIVFRWHIPESFTGPGFFQLDKVDITTPNNVSVSDGVSGGGLELSAAIPNPSANGSRFRFSLPRPTSVRFEVLDATGRRVWQQAPGSLDVGEHSLTWNGRDLAGNTAPAGIYFARLITPEGSLRTMFVRME